jgi:hypothetical protein
MEAGLSRGVLQAGVGGPVIPQQEAKSEIRHNEDWGYEQKRSDEDAEEDGQFAEGTEVPNDRDRDHDPADGELSRSGHGGPSESDDKASLRLTPGAGIRFVRARFALWPCSPLRFSTGLGFLRADEENERHFRQVAAGVIVHRSLLDARTKDVAQQAMEAGVPTYLIEDEQAAASRFSEGDERRPRAGRQSGGNSKVCSMPRHRPTCGLIRKSTSSLASKVYRTPES